jgi:hypothetical protein
MNERIRLLVAQANGYWEYGDFNIPHSVYFAETDLEKFAGSIVMEVLDVIENERFEIYSPVLQRVKEHFGVKE